MVPEQWMSGAGRKRFDSAPFPPTPSQNPAQPTQFRLNLFRHDKLRVAVERSSWSHNGNCTGRRARGYRRFDFGARNNCKRRGFTVELHAGCSTQAKMGKTRARMPRGSPPGPVRDCYFVTTNCGLLFRVPDGVTTETVPVVAPSGTVARMKESFSTVNSAGAPLKVTLVVPVR